MYHDSSVPPGMPQRGTELGLGHHGRHRPATNGRRAGMAAGLVVRTLPDEALHASAAGWRRGAGSRTPGHVGQETAAGRILAGETGPGVVPTTLRMQLPG